MITKDKFVLNLKKLKSRMPTKPKVYTPEYPKKIKEALNYYCNQRTVNSVQSSTKALNDKNWPLPLWFDYENVKVGFWNKLYYYWKQSESWKIGKRFEAFEFLSVPEINHIFFKLSYDDMLIEAFDTNKKYAFEMLLSNPLLKSRKEIINSVRNSYRNGNWVGCISTIFPLIDFVIRKFLNSTSLTDDVGKLCKLFDQNGFNNENSVELMPQIAFVSSLESTQSLFTEEGMEKFKKMQETNFRLIGAALSSFIQFANVYYSYYKEEKKTEEIQLINRHAILHGAISDFGTKANTVKLITFLYLMLELEDVFEILLAE